MSKTEVQEKEDSFLPDGYEVSSSGDHFMKLDADEARVRILSKPIIGWKYWDEEEDQPVRFRYGDKPEPTGDPENPVKEFWAMLVWNYTSKLIQVLEVHQAGIIKGIDKLSKDPDWGSPFKYDIKISKTGEGKKSRYAVIAVTHKPISDEVKEAYSAKPCNLEALFENENPFEIQSDDEEEDEKPKKKAPPPKGKKPPAADCPF